MFKHYFISFINLLWEESLSSIWVITKDENIGKIHHQNRIGKLKFLNFTLFGVFRPVCNTLHDINNKTIFFYKKCWNVLNGKCSCMICELPNYNILAFFVKKSQFIVKIIKCVAHRSENTKKGKIEKFRFTNSILVVNFGNIFIVGICSNCRSRFLSE